MVGEGDNRGWDGWMASPAQWTWIWVSSRSWWWTGKPGVLQSIGSQRVRHDWVAEQNWEPCSEQIYRQHFPAAFARFLSLCHILVIVKIFPTFPLLLYLWWWSMISSLWYYYCRFLGLHELCWCKIADSMEKYCVCCDCLPNNCFSPSLSLSLVLPISWDTTILKLGQLTIWQWLLRV